MSMKNYKLKDVHLEINKDWKIFVAVWWVYDINTDWFLCLTNQEIIDLLNNATINSSKESIINRTKVKTSLSDFSTRL